ncbi:MAG: type I-D CRISPR-associated protein Csc2, partial [Chromatiaceae bacterium]|nr:type I-D CRISPR-associated protein Csc2 [Chromatiaceae bacterium]
NVRTHFVGLYGDWFEKAETSPYELVRLMGSPDAQPVAETLAALHGLLATLHRTVITGAEVQGWVTGLIDTFNQPGAVLEREYGEAAQAMAALFDGWFGK